MAARSLAAILMLPALLGACGTQNDVTGERGMVGAWEMDWQATEASSEQMLAAWKTSPEHLEAARKKLGADVVAKMLSPVDDAKRLERERKRPQSVTITFKPDNTYQSIVVSWKGKEKREAGVWQLDDSVGTMTATTANGFAPDSSRFRLVAGGSRIEITHKAFEGLPHEPKNVLRRVSESR